MIALLRRLFNRPERHYISNDDDDPGWARCACGFSSGWDYNLRKHFEETGRIGK